MFLLLIVLSVCTGYKLPLRILGGYDADLNEYPYVIRLEVQHIGNYSNNTIIAEHVHLCTASALSKSWAVTAAHCLVNSNEFYVGYAYQVHKLVVRYGHVLNSPWINDSFSDVLNAFTHPLYTYAYVDNKLDTNVHMKNDIGIIKTTPMNITVFMKISAVDYLSLYGHEAIIAGYGVTNETVSEDKMKTGDTLMLKKPLQLLQVLISKCSKENSVIPSICLAARCDHKVTVCGGDSGGPLIHKSGIVGVLSIGHNTGHCLVKAKKKRVHIAGIVLPISPYIDWIKTYVSL